MTESQVTMKKVLDRMKMRAERDLEQFKTRFAENPAYAFSWGMDAMKAAAVLSVLPLAKAMFLDTATPHAEARADVLNRVVRAAQTPPGSTSATSNLMEQYTAAAWATIYEAAVEV